jgi:peptide/nickel transport system permease protein
MICGGIVLFWAFVSIFGEMIVPHNPLAISVMERLQPPSAKHIFGTDALGRDVLSRVFVGSRSVLFISLAATTIAITWGTIFGLYTGYFPGYLSDALLRIFEAFMALPVVLLSMVAVVALGPSSITVILVIGILFIPVVAKTVRAVVLVREVLPNISGTIVVEATVRLGYAIFITATLSFLGLGVQPPTPDWGLMIYENFGLVSAGIWWPVFFPALAIASLVISISLIAERIFRNER